MGLLLGLEGLFHLLDVLVQAFSDVLDSFGRLFLDGLLTGLHTFFVLEGKFFLGCLDNSLLILLQVGKSLVVVGLGFVQSGLSHLGFMGAERLLGVQFAFQL